tara:strand:+ start:778 stop:1542 length:765 start_codon:yes stop_codon:yes gene_type:complete
MKFVIPSFGRISELKEKSLKFLKKYDIDLKDIYIFVREDDNQLWLYESLEDINIVICNVKGIGRTHNFITEYFEEGEIIIELDDDLVKMVDRNKEEITDLKGEINKMIKLMEEQNISYGGIYQVDNSMFMKTQDNYTYDLRYCLGIFRIRKICKDIKLETNYSEDFENCILHYIRDGKIIKNNHLCAITKNYAKGGCNADGRNNESEKIDKEFLSNKYPQFCKLFQRKSGIWDLRLKAYKQKSTNKMGSVAMKV